MSALSDILASLHLLSCWSQLNTSRFNRYRSLIDCDLADKFHDFRHFPRISGKRDRQTILCEHSIILKPI